MMEVYTINTIKN